MSSLVKTLDDLAIVSEHEGDVGHTTSYSKLGNTKIDSEVLISDKSEVKKFIDKSYTEVITNNNKNDVVINGNNNSRKKIKKDEDSLICIEGNGKTISELEKSEKIDKNILRYLTVKVKKLDLKINYFEKKEEMIGKL